ncbi:hypothetical protein DRO69_06680 [Candidatus Bathyarchaeota archaeon]|nr:MAG: hypothetical protein DRO69_06680 [Candidatus Bathyarchaeota archaeon]
MKRWKIFLGRGGTVLIAIGLALLLVSLIPSAQVGSFTVSGWIIFPKRFETSFEGVLTPQQGLQVTITANDTLTVYILEVRAYTLYEWINEHHPEKEMTFDFNVTNLEEFLETNPDKIGWQKEMREGKIEYVPTKVTNATLVFSNPSSNYIRVDYEGSMISLVAPGTKVRNLAQWTIPIGFVLTLPWLTQLWKEKTTHRSAQNR